MIVDGKMHKWWKVTHTHTQKWTFNLIGKSIEDLSYIILSKYGKSMLHTNKNVNCDMIRANQTENAYNF